MPKHTITLTPEVREVLQNAEIDGKSLKLIGLLDRKLYEAVNKVLVAAGGKWNRSAQAHLFTSDPREVLGLAIETGGIVDTKKALQQFDTPPGLAAKLIRLAAIDEGDTVLEPSAGLGNLATPARSANGIVYCVEVDDVRVQTLRKGGHIVTKADFLNLTPAKLPYGWPTDFSRVVMNPPFTASQDIKHILHAWQFLQPGGVLAAITAPGWTFKDDRASRNFLNFVRDHLEHEEAIEAGTFSGAGTEVATRLIVLRKAA